MGEEAKKEFINLYGKILRYKNILSSFDEFEGNEILSERAMNKIIKADMSTFILNSKKMAIQKKRA
ncbi:MAG: type I restriction endonuclease subunit R, EcoR124 family [Synergistaceae bacterium]